MKNFIITEKTDLFFIKRDLGCLWRRFLCGYWIACMLLTLKSQLYVARFSFVIQVAEICMT